MTWKFRLTREEAERIDSDIRSGKLCDCSPAIWRELREITRLGDSYPYRETKR